MTTDTSERGLERLICKALAGDVCDPPKEGTVGDASPGYYCFDIQQKIKTLLPDVKIICVMRNPVRRTKHRAIWSLPAMPSTAKRVIAKPLPFGLQKFRPRAIHRGRTLMRGASSALSAENVWIT